MRHLHKVLHDVQWIMFHGHLDFVSSPPQRGGSNIKQEIMTLQSMVMALSHGVKWL